MEEELVVNTEDKKELFRISRMYYDICCASCTGNHWGLSVRELRQRYHLKKRDIPVFLKFFTNYDIACDGISLNYSIYRFINNKQIPDEDIVFENLSVESYQEIFNEKEIDDDCYIQIRDYITIIQEKIDWESVDLTNVSFVKNIKEQVYDLWDSISAVKLNPEYIVSKKTVPELSEHLRQNKKNWIYAIVNCHFIEMEYRISGRKTINKKVFPLGIYYDKFLEEYICIYEKDGKEVLEIELENIFKISVKEKSYKTESRFQIDEYIKKEQTCKMVLKVYHEAKVVQKLRDLLEDNQLQVVEYDDYDVLQFMTRDPWRYLRIINGFGKSVVVLEPDYIQQSVLDIAKDALAFYASDIDYE